MIIQSPATIDCWLIKLVFQLYNALYDQNNGYILDSQGNKLDRMKFKLTLKEIDLLSFTYTRLVQERVVEGIKHTTGGSLAFQMYFLKNIMDSKTVETVRKELEHDFELSKQLVSKFLTVLEFSDFENKIIEAARSFISKYNKGKLPFNEENQKLLETWETFIQENTYFGSLVEPLFAINKQIEDLKQNQFNLLNVSTEETSSTLDDDFDIPFLN